MSEEAFRFFVEIVKNIITNHPLTSPISIPSHYPTYPF